MRSLGRLASPWIIIIIIIIGHKTVSGCLLGYSCFCSLHTLNKLFFFLISRHRCNRIRSFRQRWPVVIGIYTVSWKFGNRIMSTSNALVATAVRFLDAIYVRRTYAFDVSKTCNYFYFFRSTILIKDRPTYCIRQFVLLYYIEILSFYL